MTRKRRSFTPEYKAEVVGLIRDGGKGITAVCRDLGLTESAVRKWVSQSEADSGRGDGKILTTVEREEPGTAVGADTTSPTTLAGMVRLTPAIRRSMSPSRNAAGFAAKIACTADHSPMRRSPMRDAMPDSVSLQAGA